MSHDETHIAGTEEKLMRMANQIATFFHSKPREEGIAGVVDHINKFWEPRMRRHLFEMIDAGKAGFDEFVLEAAPKIRRPPVPQAGPPPQPIPHPAGTT
ncbi:MAG: formate dehydrogenase subunit delta [Rhizobiales bacterium]|nr:formate dehydrogenase subunit delta [Hyphomicrobiales bacterium]